MRILPLFLICLLDSCAGYRFQDRSNPFKQYGIRSISIPMFYNQSSHSNISSLFTKEMYKMISEFNNLKVTSGKIKSDATLVGILESSGKIIDIIVPSAPRSAGNVGDSSTAERKEFYVPSVSTVNLVLRVIVIKGPSEEEIRFLRSKASTVNFVSSKIIFSETINLSNSFTREIFDGDNNDVIHSQNRGALRKSYIAMSKSAAQTFKEMILYAF